MICSNNPTRAGHVFNHGRRAARNMLGKMAGNHPGIKIKRTSGGVADDEAYSLVFEKLRLRAHWYGENRETKESRQCHFDKSNHVASLFETLTGKSVRYLLTAEKP